MNVYTNFNPIDELLIAYQMVHGQQAASLMRYLINKLNENGSFLGEVQSQIVQTKKFSPK